MAIGFGEFVFDGEARELRRGGETVALSPKALQLLAMLLAVRPRALSRQELQDALWPDVHVTHTSLPRVVNELRRALADDSKSPRFVRTVHAFGYAFKTDTGTVGNGSSSSEPDRPPIPFSLLWGGRQIPLQEGETILGRAPECGVRIDSPKVSRRHARIVVQGDKATIEDLGSKNGTTVASERLERRRGLADGDEVRIGPAELLFLARGEGSTETEARGRLSRSRRTDD